MMAFQIFGPSLLVNYKQLATSAMCLVMAAFGAGFAIFGMLVPAIYNSIDKSTNRNYFWISFNLYTTYITCLLIHLVYYYLFVFICSSGSGAAALYMSIIPAETVTGKVCWGCDRFHDWNCRGLWWRD